MSIIKILARTIVLFTCGIILVIGVLSEGLSKLLDQFGVYLLVLDGKLARKGKPKVKETAKEIPT